MKIKTTCPRCGYDKASANARGPNVVHCKRCDGLVPLDQDLNEGGTHLNNPLRSAIDAEDREFEERKAAKAMRRLSSTV